MREPQLSVSVFLVKGTGMDRLEDDGVASLSKIQKTNVLHFVAIRVAYGNRKSAEFPDF